MADARLPASRLVAATIAWARGLIPDFHLQAVVSEDPTLFGLKLMLPPVGIGRAVEAPREMPLSRQLWRHEWERRLEAIRKDLELVHSVVTPVSDAEHRMLLVKALETARERLVISSRTLGIGVLAKLPVKALQEAVARGVRVTLIYSEERDSAGEQGRWRAELESAGVRLLVRDIHSKVLVCDDWAVVSSFNFLSFEGYFSDRGRARHELGVRILGQELADKVAMSVEAAPYKDGSSEGTALHVTAEASPKPVAPLSPPAGASAERGK